MALVCIEGFDFLNSQALLTLRNWVVSASGVTFSTAGRFGGQCANFHVAGGTGTATKTLPATYTTLTVGFAFQLQQTGSATQTFFNLFTSASALISSVRWNSGTKVLEVLNSAATVIATGTTTINLNSWHYLEVKFVINGASGSVEVHLDGVTEIASATQNIGSTGANKLQFAANVTSSTILVDDFYVTDTTGSTNTGFLGDVRVATVFPTGAGAHTAWTPNGAANNWDCVNDASPDDDTTYISDATPNDIDTYVVDDVDAAATVFGVQVHLYARKDDANTRQIAPVIRQAGTDNVGTTVTLGATYAYFDQIYNQDPTATNWTASTFNGDEFGVKEIA